MQPTKPLTEQMKHLLELEAKKPEITAYYEDLDATLAEVHEQIGMGYFEASDGTVFKLDKPAGAFTYYKDIAYTRTKRPEEPTGGHVLAKKTAELARDAGLIVHSGKLVN